MNIKKLFLLFFLVGLGNSLLAQAGKDSLLQIDPLAFDSIVFHFRGSAISSEKYSIVVANDTIIKIDTSRNRILNFEEELWEGVLHSRDSTYLERRVELHIIQQKAYYIAFELLQNNPSGYVDSRDCLGGNLYKLTIKHRQAGSKSIIWQCVPPPQCEEELEELIEMLNGYFY